ncbi:MAG TPA: tRNA (adenosine(37)-N6)-threonylcarbamoyltransferase complex dimerization subunit type 1 TsaB [Spirochaetota bacterium]
MRTLLIECATDTAFIAVHASGRFAERLAHGKASHSVRLFALIDEALAECGITINDIELIAVGVGPGSFTGIRIAVSTGRMLAQVLSVPLIGIPSTEIFASSLAQHPFDSILIAFDAKKGRVFGALYAVDENRSLHETLAPGDYYPAEVVSHFGKENHILMAGDGAEKYADIFSAQLVPPTLFPSFSPDGKSAVLCAIKKYTENPDAFRDVEKVLPHYARKSDAEVLREEREKSST